MATTTHTFQNYIGGEWVDAASGETFDSTSPADGELIGTFPRSGADDVDRAVEVAKEAFAEWRLVPAPKRGEILYRFAQLVTDHKAELTDLMTHEMGKVKAEAGGDVQEAIDMSYYMGGEGRRLFGQTTPSELPNKFQMSVRMPIGVIGVITPWNFPIAIPSWKIAPALVCREHRRLQAGDGHPGARAAIRRAPRRRRRSRRRGQHRPRRRGSGRRAPGEASRRPRHHAHRLARHRRQGSRGRRGAAEARPSRARRQERDHRHGRRRPRPRARRDPVVGVRHVRDSGARRRAASSSTRASTTRSPAGSSSGPKRFGSAPAGRTTPTSARSSTAPRSRRSTRTRRSASDDGATLLTGGEIADEGDLASGFYYRPTIFGDVEPGMRIAQEEIFGPTLSLIRFRDEADAIRISNGIAFGLSSSIFTRDVNRAFRAMRDLEAGITYINAGTIGAEVHLPFGGTKETGNGHREAGQAALDVFTEWKSVYVDYSGTLQRAQIDNA